MRLLTRPNLGGPARQAVALWHAHRREGIRTLLVTGRCREGEQPLDLEREGLPRIAEPREDAEGFLELRSLSRRPAPWRDLVSLRALSAAIDRFRPHVLHTHTSKAGLLGRRAARRARVPVTAHTFHGHVLRGYFGGVLSALLRLLERRLAARTDLLFAVSPSCAGELEQMRVVEPGRIRVLPPAVPAAGSPADSGTVRDAARERLGIAQAAWHGVWAGRLVGVKRPDHLPELVGTCPDLHLDVYGTGPLGSRLERVDRLRLRGGEPELQELMPAYDFLVLTSEREGCPLVAIEAFAAGIPVVGFDVPGVRDALGPWGGGVLVPQVDGPAGLARALESLRVDPELRARCIADGRTNLFRFEPTAVAAELSAAYRGALAAARTADRAGLESPDGGKAAGVDQ